MSSQNYVWPQTLIRPSQRLVYLDLMHWIGLAKADTGHRDGLRFRSVYGLCIRRASAGEALFPLSATHYLETQKIKNPAQRSAIAKVMEELSAFRTLLPGDLIRHQEIEAYFTEVLGPSRKPAAVLPLVGKGAAWAFGKEAPLRIKDLEGRDVTESVRARHPAGPEGFDRIVRDAQLRFERSVLAGPSAEEIEALRALGWKPERVVEIIERRANEEREQSARFDSDPLWRRGRTRDVVSAREFLIELNEMVATSLANRGISIHEWPQSRDELRALMDSMPSTDVAVTLKTWAHRNASKTWAGNDIHDIDALSVAVPYCDVVVTEKFAQTVLTAAKVPERSGTLLLRRLEELEDVLR